MMVLCLDFGNTFCKSALIDDGKILDKHQFLVKDALENIEKILSDFSVTHSILSSVLHPQQEVIAYLHQSTIFTELTHYTPLPFINLYKTPSTLGKDRLAVIAFAGIQFPNQNTLVICAGTCVTYNFINYKNEFLGGGISPGLQMRFKAMNHFTQKLPLAENKQTPNVIGNDTISSLQSGAINGLSAEIDGIIEKYELEFEKINVVLTGGDMLQLAVLLKKRIFADADFLFKGLHTILQFNNS
jgi:type III pantothenate kinase